MSRRRLAILTALAGSGVVVYAATPLIVHHGVVTELESLGFPDAEVDVEHVGLHHVRLANVHLANGVDLGKVDIEPGLGLLWSSPSRVTVRDALATADGLTAAGKQVAAAPAPAKRSASRTTLEIEVTLRDPRTTDWNVHANGDVVIGTGGEVSIDDATVDIKLAHATVARGVTVGGAVIHADVSGNVASNLAATGRLRADTIDVPHLSFLAADLPFTIDGRGLAFGAAHARALGGEVSTAPVAWRDGSYVQLRAHGLSLGDVVGSRRVKASGLVDGDITLRVADNTPLPYRGELHARGPGTIEVADRALRDKLAKTQVESPTAIHARVADALTAFRYDTLVAELSDPSSMKELTLSTSGRGIRTPQELELVVNVHGLRDWMGGP